MKTIITHNGGFHADDVFAAATLSLFFKNEDIKIIRTRDPETIKTGDVVFDVGRIYDEEKNLFDHHQEGGAGVRENGIPYASFGLVWKKFGPKICGQNIADLVEGRLVLFVDAVDNGIDLFTKKTSVSNYSISDVVGVFNEEKGEEEIYKTFLLLVDFALKIIEKEIAAAKEYFEGEEEIKKSYNEASDKRLIVLDRQFKKIILNEVLQKYPDVLFVIQPYDLNGFALRAIRKNQESFENRKSLPKIWAGKIDKELQDITGVADAKFCHNALFVANTQSKEGALALAKLALEN